MSNSFDYNALNETINSNLKKEDSYNQESMNIIINDCDCSDGFFVDICSSLLNEGIEFQVVKNCKGINIDGSTVITLDQLYNSGKTTMIFAPYDNTRIGYSDSLALSFKAAFNQNGFDINKIYCGKTGFFEEKEGNISKFGATETEQAIDSLAEVSFVTLSLGTECKNPTIIANIIKDALVRQKYYLDNYDKNTDLIYRASEIDSVENVANYFGANADELKLINSIKDNTFQDSQAIINPNVIGMPVFDKNAIFSLSDSSLKVR